MSEVLYNHKWMNLIEDSNGDAFVAMDDDAVMLVPMSRHQEIFLIEEKSIAYQTTVLTLPTGAVESGELPEISANRELQEEAGLEARVLTHIGVLHPAIKYMRWRCHVYLAQNLIRADLEGDETSPIKVQPIHISQVDKIIQTQKLSDATSIAAIYLARQHLSA